MSQELLYSATGIALFCLALHSVIVAVNIITRIIAINIMGIGIFMLLVAIANQAGQQPDPVPHAMVLTGIVVAVAGTALALALVRRLQQLHIEETSTLDSKEKLNGNKI